MVGKAHDGCTRQRRNPWDSCRLGRVEQVESLVLFWLRWCYGLLLRSKLRQHNTVEHTAGEHDTEQQHSGEKAGYGGMCGHHLGSDGGMPHVTWAWEARRIYRASELLRCTNRWPKAMRCSAIASRTRASTCSSVISSLRSAARRAFSNRTCLIRRVRSLANVSS